MRLDVSTFEYLCSTLAPLLTKQDTSMRLAVPVQVKVAVAISRLVTCSSMQNIVDLYKIGLSTSQLAVSEFSGAMKAILLKKFLRWPSASVMNKFAQEFQTCTTYRTLWGLSMGHTYLLSRPACTPPTTTTVRVFTPYSYKVLFLVNAFFWDFDIGWVGSMHDANLWAMMDIGKFCKAGKLSPYVLVGDAAYLCRPWMLALFKGHKDGLTREEYHWNYVQSSTRMCIERAFGMLKCRWRILLKRVDVYLKNVPELVATCLLLHNICIIFGDTF
jgi:hypothetical protein